MLKLKFFSIFSSNHSNFNIFMQYDSAAYRLGIYFKYENLRATKINYAQPIYHHNYRFIKQIKFQEETAETASPNSILAFDIVFFIHLHRLRLLHRLLLLMKLSIFYKCNVRNFFVLNYLLHYLVRQF